MLSYLMRRLLLVPFILLIVSFIVFTIARLGPGDPVRVAAGQFNDPEAFERVRAARGLDKPIYEQYVIYMGDVLQGHLGLSFRFGDRPVEDIIFPALWRSFQFNAVALWITLWLGIPAGIYAARKQGTWRDPTSIGTFLFFQSVPSLVMLPFLIYIFALKLSILPPNGWPQDCLTVGFLPENYNCIGVLSREALIPLFALSIPGVAFWARYTRATTLAVLNEDYVRTARAKGIDEFGVMADHVMRNALLPMSTLLAFSLLTLLEGAFFVENISGIPGIGYLAFDSVGSRDYDMIMAITLIGSTAFVLVSILVDMVYVLIDPRVTYDANR
jgi:ABC-type dipeptide/oligopeptide/nickel transport system permease component